MTLGDRIKGYEKVFSQRALKRTPLMIRVDGKAFHTFTRDLEKPFDKGLMEAMIKSAQYTAEKMQGFKVAYIQSDEVTFVLTDYDTLETEGWFNYKINKVVSISAAMMSASFNVFYATNKLALFDSRAFNVPKEDVLNALLWRAKDWHRNSIQMFARAFFSHKELHKKSLDDIHEMLHSIGKNWTTDLLPIERNGTFLIKTEEGIITTSEILPTYVDLQRHLGKLF